jgi:hypothetical protein
MDKLIINGITYIAVNSAPKQEHIHNNKLAKERRYKSRRAHLRLLIKALRKYRDACEELLRENIELRCEKDDMKPPRKSWWRHLFK